VAACTAAAQQKNPADYVNGKNGYLESFCQRCSLQTPGIGDAAASLAPQPVNFGQVNRAIELTRQALATDPLNSRWCGWLANYFSALNRHPRKVRSDVREVEVQAARWMTAVGLSPASGQ
jgi:hypothetical protein